MTTRKTNGMRRERLPSSFLTSRRFAVRRLRARVLSSLNLKKKRGCSQSDFASNDTKWIFRCSYCQINDYHNKAALILNPKFLEDVLAILCDQTSSLNLNKINCRHLTSVVFIALTLVGRSKCLKQITWIIILIVIMTGVPTFLTRSQWLHCWGTREVRSDISQCV